MAWPSGHEQPATRATTTCRVRPLPDTIRPCRPDGAAPTDRQAHTEHAVVPVHHLAACCVVGTALWAGVITFGRFAIHVVTHLG
jgi:hypothetical protein